MSLSKRYQVFVSSTYRDLKDERSEVIRALLDLECFPSAMEFFPADDEALLDYIENIISSSDYHVIIVGGSYGSVNDDRGISYTQSEYEIAKRHNIPVVAFIRSDWENIVKEKDGLNIEEYKSLQAFIDILNNRLVRKWSNIQDLGYSVLRTMTYLFRQKPGVGWIRGNEKTELYYHALEQKEKLFEESQNLQDKISFLESQIQHLESQIQQNSPIELLHDFDAVWRSFEKCICEIIDNQNESNTLKIRILGVCLHKSFPKLKNFLLTNDLKGIRIEIRLGILNNNSDAWAYFDDRGNSLRDNFQKDLNTLVSLLNKRKLEGKLTGSISIKLHEYSYMPNFHGVMLNKQEVFMCISNWDSDGLYRANHNIYEHYQSDISDIHKMKIAIFRRWFDFGRYNSEQRLIFDSE